MKRYLSCIAWVGFVFSGSLYAHAHLQKSAPADNSTLSSAPKTLSLEFSEGIQLTALTLQKGDGKAQDLGPLPKEAGKQATLALPALDAGNYIVKWRGVSADKHIASGKITFKVP